MNKPYFMQNTKWYKVANEVQKKELPPNIDTLLTEIAPEKATVSYQKYYGLSIDTLYYCDENGDVIEEIGILNNKGPLWELYNSDFI